MIRITDDIFIPAGELSFTFSRSSKPGGQNVNKISSRVTLQFDVANSPELSEAHKHRIITRLRTRINKDGVLRVSAQVHRHQAANRAVALERFAELLRKAIAPVKARKKTRISAAAVNRRLKKKKHRSRLKQERSKPFPPGE